MGLTSSMQGIDDRFIQNFKEEHSKEEAILETKV
jgi:hypothetical protein